MKQQTQSVLFQIKEDIVFRVSNLSFVRTTSLCLKAKHKIREYQNSSIFRSIFLGMLYSISRKSLSATVFFHHSLSSAFLPLHLAQFRFNLHYYSKYLPSNPFYTNLMPNKPPSDQLQMYEKLNKSSTHY